jgi:hypothetical protein
MAPSNPRWQAVASTASSDVQTSSTTAGGVRDHRIHVLWLTNRPSWNRLSGR